MSNNKLKELERVVIRFAGDSGDGMQLTGNQFSLTSAELGNDMATFPDYPAEIRAPQGTVEGVSGFQLQIGEVEVYTAGDECDVLVAMNAAALKANMKNIVKGGTIVVDEDSFSKKDLEKAGYKQNPLKDGSLHSYTLIPAPISSMTRTALVDSGLDNKTAMRTKNMFALGIMYFLFNRSLVPTMDFIKSKFEKKPDLVDANIAVLRAGYYYAETVEAFTTTYKVSTARIEAGKYRTANGNTCVAWGLIAAAEKAGKMLYCGSYPITPASDILHELAARKELGVVTLQSEDEIAAICSSIGAAYAGNLAVTTSSGPGIALKTEAIGLAIMAELPVVIVDVQRGGPSTGLPTKTEQTDFNQAVLGRNGEAPLVVIAASTPANCFKFAFEASRIALEHTTPVMLLTDAYLANGAEPWKIPSMNDLPSISPNVFDPARGAYKPYGRDPEKLARWLAIPGTPGCEHHIGGLEKEHLTGNVSYDADNHAEMVAVRAEKIERVKKFIPHQKVYGPKKGSHLVIGWGSTSGAIYAAMKELHAEDNHVSWAQFNYLSPLPENTEEILRSFDRILVCELNSGQFARHLRGLFSGLDIAQCNKVSGMPFTVQELKDHINEFIN